MRLTERLRRLDEEESVNKNKDYLGEFEGFDDFDKFDGTAEHIEDIISKLKKAKFSDLARYRAVNELKEIIGRLKEDISPRVLNPKGRGKNGSLDFYSAGETIVYMAKLLKKGEYSKDARIRIINKLMPLIEVLEGGLENIKKLKGRRAKTDEETININGVEYVAIDEEYADEGKTAARTFPARGMGGEKGVSGRGGMAKGGPKGVRILSEFFKYLSEDEVLEQIILVAKDLRKKFDYSDYKDLEKLVTLLGDMR